MFEKGTCVEIINCSKNDNIYYIDGQVKYNNDNKLEYLCVHKYNEHNKTYISEDQIRLKEYFKVECCERGCEKIIDGRLSNNLCKSCNFNFCDECYRKSTKQEFEFRNLCNDCIWFSLG